MAVTVRYTKFQFKIPPQISENEYESAKIRIKNDTQDNNLLQIVKFNDVQRGSVKLILYNIGIIGLITLIYLIIFEIGAKKGGTIDLIIVWIILFFVISLIYLLFSLLFSYRSYTTYKRKSINYNKFRNGLIIRSKSYKNFLDLYSIEIKKAMV
jgi:hypothetical protein